MYVNIGAFVHTSALVLSLMQADCDNHLECTLKIDNLIQMNLNFIGQS